MHLWFSYIFFKGFLWCEFPCCLLLTQLQEVYPRTSSLDIVFLDVCSYTFCFKQFLLIADPYASLWFSFSFHDLGQRSFNLKPILTWKQLVLEAVSGLCVSIGLNHIKFPASSMPLPASRSWDVGGKSPTQLYSLLRDPILRCCPSNSTAASCIVISWPLALCNPPQLKINNQKVINLVVYILQI